MPTFSISFSRKDMRKVWRYPDVSIPARLRSRYKEAK